MLILWANQVCKKSLAVSFKKVTEETRNSKLEGLKKLNLAVKIERVFDQTVHCTGISFTVWIGCFGGKSRRKNERNDRIHIEEDIECHKHQHLDQTWTCSVAIHCSFCGIAASTNAGHQDVQIRNLNLKPIIYPELLAVATPSFDYGSNVEKHLFRLCLTISHLLNQPHQPHQGSVDATATSYSTCYAAQAAAFSNRLHLED